MLLLLVAFLALCAHGLRWDSPTVDEFAHLPAGYYYLKTGNFELYNGNPPLIKMWSALPLLAMAPELDTTAKPRENPWYPWLFATDFMRRNRDRYRELFLAGRLPVVALGSLLGLLVWRWARRLYGEAAGVVAMAAVVFCPVLVGHAHLATIDVGFALATVGVAWLAQRYWERPGLGGLLVLGAAVGVALLVKFTAILLYPILALLAAVSLALGVPAAASSTEPPEPPETETAAPPEPPATSAPAKPIGRRVTGREAARAAGAFALMVLVSLAVVDAGYLFHDVGRTAGELNFHSRVFQAVSRRLPAGLPLPLPAAFLHGFDSLQRINEDGEYPTYFLGRWLNGVPVSYYLTTLLLKIPLPLLLAWLAAPFVRPFADGRRRGEVFLWLPALVLLAVFSLGSRVGYGIRYVLPIVPLACIYASRLVPWVLERGRAVQAAALALLLVYPTAVLAATPDTLAYFNVLAGGQGDRYLLDSNLDWGQGLERLSAYVERKGLPGIQLAYFGHVDPALYDLRWRFPDPRRPGLVAVSANFLHGYPYATNAGGHMIPVPADAFTWISRYPRRADLGGGIYIYEVGAGGAGADSSAGDAGGDNGAGVGR